jgi:Tfp pilus assembly protein PilF
MERWRVLGIIASLVIVISLPLYVLQQAGREKLPQEKPAAHFVTSEACAKCHKKEYDEWQQSHHAKAMAVADSTTVLGNFNDTVFSKNGIESRFYRKNNRFFVHTRGSQGEMAEFEISHTFGWFPLQQYLVPFPNGKMQCLPIAWDVREKKWFHLYPDLQLDPEEWIYWTNQGQNWNSMCASCHSTQLQKQYSPLTDSYATEWAEISVGCEACHGPASKHITWAELPEMARPENDGLQVQTSGSTHRQQVELCAPCHSRSSLLGDYSHQRSNLLDTEIPRLLEERLYFPDGQILDEVYVYGSFVQSKMYANDVRCSDCHNIHTIKLHQEGNKLCLQCHQASIYDKETHHFHKQKDAKGEPIRSAGGEIIFEVGSGAQCVQCHMPGRLYMVNDYRPDHSIRVPRPDLSISLGTPNSCIHCHVDKSNEWAAGHTQKWYGSKRKYQFGTTFQDSRDGKLQAKEELIQLVSDSLSPDLVRATALSLLGRYQGDDVSTIFKQVLISDKAIIRSTALLFLPYSAAAEQMLLIGPLLTDPVKGVRVEAARAMMRIPSDQLEERWQKAFKRALTEFEKVALYSADFAASRLNLGALYSYQGQDDKAELQFKKAVEINRDFYAARMNLAVMYSRQGKLDLAEEQLRKALVVNPDLPDVHYSLGLLLSEKRKYTEAVEHLQKAADTGRNGRAYYNLGQLLDFLRRDKDAEAALVRSIELEPANIQYLQTIVSFYLKRRNFAKAQEIGDQILLHAPDNPLGQQVLDIIQEQP